MLFGLTITRLLLWIGLGKCLGMAYTPPAYTITRLLLWIGLRVGVRVRVRFTYAH